MSNSVSFLFQRTDHLIRRSNNIAYHHLVKKLDSHSPNQYKKTMRLSWLNPRKTINLILGGITTFIATILTYFILSIFVLPYMTLRALYNQDNWDEKRVFKAVNTPDDVDTAFKIYQHNTEIAKMPNYISLYPFLVLLGTWLKSLFYLTPVFLWYNKQLLLTNIYFKSSTGFFNALLENRTFIATLTAIAAVLSLVIFPPASLAPLTTPILAMGPKLALSLGLDAHWSLALSAVLTALSTMTTLMVINLTRDVCALSIQTKNHAGFREKKGRMKIANSNSNKPGSNSSKQKRKEESNRFVDGDRSPTSNTSYPYQHFTNPLHRVPSGPSQKFTKKYRHRYG